MDIWQTTIARFFSLKKILHVARPSLNASIIVEEIEGVSGWRCVKLLKIFTGAELAVLG